MADSAFKTQVSRDENANSASNVMYIQIADNAGNSVSVTGGKLDVNASVTLETAYVDDSAFTIGTDKVNAQGYLADETATDSVDEGDIGLARMTLTRIQLATIDDGAGNRLTIDGSGYITSNINGTVTVDANGSDVTVDNAAGAAAVNIQDGGNSITVDGTVAVSSIGGTVTVSATDLDIRDLDYTLDNVEIKDAAGDALGINADGSINVVVAGSGGTKVHDYKTATPGAGASDNHDYTVSTGPFELSRVEWAGSGKIKVEVQVGPLASLVTKAVGFSEKDSKDYIEFNPTLSVPATGTGTVRVIVTNRQGAAVDVYSTIMGTDA
jgi:hypothetical protein